MHIDLNRRTLLSWATGAAIVALVEPRSTRRAAAAGPVEATSSAAATLDGLGRPSDTLRLVRADDQLDLVVELFDLTVAGDTVTITGGAPALRLRFGSQHTAEGASEPPFPTVPIAGIDHIAAGESVVVIPVSGTFPLTVAGILDLAAAATGVAAQGSPGDPHGAVTALEVPAGLLLSPAAPTRLIGAPAPFTFTGVTEVWAGRFEPAGGPGALQLAAIANLAADDLVTVRLPDREARDELVTNTTSVAPLTADQLWLTSAGAFADLHGTWTTGGLALYDHRIAAGRDLHVEVDTLGYLLPFGHRAAIASVSERVIVDDARGGATSVLQVERYLTIVDPVITSRPFARNDGRGLPLTTLTATTDSTVAVTLAPVVDAGGVIIDGANDVVSAAGGDVLVGYRTIDRGGNTVSFVLPATFVDDRVAHDLGVSARLEEVANGAARRPRREVDLAGQPVAYADPVGTGDATTKRTHAFTLAWEGPDPTATATDLEVASTPAIYAALAHAEVIDDVVASVSGANGESVGVTLHPRWLQHGNESENFDLAFLTLDEQASGAIGAGQPVGGVAQLDLLADVFNQVAGVGPDLDAPNERTPANALGAASKIIGNILLQEVLATIEDAIPGLDIPGTTVTVDPDTKTVTAAFTFCPTLKSAPAVGFVADERTKCCIHLTTVGSLDNGVEASFTTEMRIENFMLEFPPGVQPPLVIVDFESVVGTVSSDGSTSFVPTVREWDFSGTISILLALVDHLGLANVDLRILGDTIDMDSSINLPDISLGVAELKNFNIGLGFELPLDNGPGQLSIGIGSRSSPLDIDIMMFGATFWLDIDLQFNGFAAPTQTISMGLSVYWEMLDFDIVVVSVSFTLRLSADWKISGDAVVFTGAVSLEGEVDVLGLVSVSASVVCSLTYRSADEEMVLRGTINYCVDSFLGKLTQGSVPIGETTIELGDGQQSAALRNGAGPTARRSAAAASGGAASFGQRWSEDTWTDYCHAFAAA